MTGFDRLQAAAAGQLGSFTRAQAKAAGLSDRELRSGVHRRTLDRAGIRTYRSVLAPHTLIGDLTDLVLDVGEPCWSAVLMAPRCITSTAFDSRVRSM